MEGTEVIQRVAEALTDDSARLKTSPLVSGWQHETRKIALDCQASQQGCIYPLGCKVPCKYAGIGCKEVLLHKDL